MRNYKRRPYRVVKRQKNNDTENNSTMCLLKDKKSFCTIFIIAICAFIDGIILGHILSKNS